MTPNKFLLIIYFVDSGDTAFFAQYSIKLWRLQGFAGILGGALAPNHGGAVDIINAKHCISPTRSVVYHQAAGGYTLKRDDMHRTSRGDDMPSLRFG